MSHGRKKKPNGGKQFADSLTKWGGWAKLISNFPDFFTEDISKTIKEFAEIQKSRPPKIGKLSAEQWAPIAEALPIFLNAYLQQEMHRILDGPVEILTALRLVDDDLVGRLLLALVIVAREQNLAVEAIYRCPYSPNRIEDSRCQLSRQWLATLTITISKEYADEHLPMLLHHHGDEVLWDKEQSTPENPVWVRSPIDRKFILFVDGLGSSDATVQQRQRDEFLHRQGFNILRFSRPELENDIVGCAVGIVKQVCGKSLPPPEPDED